jgi:hypothetical protein
MVLSSLSQGYSFAMVLISLLPFRNAADGVTISAMLFRLLSACSLQLACG